MTNRRMNPEITEEDMKLFGMSKEDLAILEKKLQENSELNSPTIKPEKEVELQSLTSEPEQEIVYAPAAFVEKTPESAYELFLKFTRRAVVVVGTGALLYGMFGISQKAGEVGIRNEQINKELRNAYDKATSKYADTNSDGILSLEELNIFDKVFLSSHGIKVSGRTNLKYGSMSYEKNSIQPVSKETIIEWLNNYKPE